MPRRSSSSSPPYSSPSSNSPGKKGKPRSKSKKKIHTVVVCEHEKYDVKPVKSIRTKKLIRYVRPIGQDPEPGQTMATKEPELQPFGCKVLKAIVGFVDQLHKMNYTLKGKLNTDMLCWVKSSKTVKLRKDSINDMEKYSVEGAAMDYRSIGTSICKDLFRGQEVPRDVKAWTDLMIADPFNHKYLIKYNIALLPRRAKMDLFVSLYQQLLQLREQAGKDDASNDKYFSVVDGIPVAKRTEQYEWTSHAMFNKFVGKVYKYNRDGRSGSAFGLLAFVRDCISHLVDYSVEDNVLLFSVDDKYNMIEACFPGVFHQFQRAMADVGFEDEGLKAIL